MSSLGSTIAKDGIFVIYCSGFLSLENAKALSGSIVAPEGIVLSFVVLPNSSARSQLV